jgi:O-antigen ligase
MIFNRIKSNSINYQELGILSLFFVLPFYHKYATTLITILFLLTFIELIRSKKLPTIHIHWFFPALFLYFVVSQIIWGGEWSSLEKRLPLILIPILFAINNEFFREGIRRKIYTSYIAGNILLVSLCLVRAFVRSIKYRGDAWVFNPKVIENSPYDFLTSSVMGGNYFISSDFSWFQHPTYASIYIVVAQYLVFELFRLSPISSRRYKWGLFVCYLFFVFAIFLLSSKAGVICSIAVTFGIILTIKVRRDVKVYIISTFALVLILFIGFNPRLKEFARTFNTTNLIDPNAQYGYSLRMLSWDASMTVIREHWLVGVGEANKESALLKIYKAKGYVEPLEKGHNSHNQYLDILIGGGIIGFILFIAGLFQLTIKSIRQRNLALSAILFIFSFNALFENLFSRHSGILLFTLFVCLLMGKSKTDGINSKNVSITF